MDGVRVLRPRNAPAATPEPVVGSSEKKGRKKSVVKKKACGEMESIRSQCKYLLNRINYEQNLLDAYAAEGWRGQRFVKLVLFPDLFSFSAFAQIHYFSFFFFFGFFLFGFLSLSF